VEFPIFENCINRVSFTFGTELERESRRRIIRNFLRVLLKEQCFGQLPLEDLRYLIIKERPTVSVRGCLLSRDGKLVKCFGVFGEYQAGHSFEVNINELLSAHGLPVNNAMFLVVLSRGRRDAYKSSPGSISMSYEGESFFATYRTGAFARTLNDFSVRKHRGFISINPKVIVNAKQCSSIFLINHSSNPDYDDIVYPKARIYRSDGRYLEADYGPVPPFGGVERSIEQLFGESVGEFLALFGGLGTSVVSAEGYSLAGLSILRNRDGKSMAIEHTRPTHVNLQPLLPE
jgi:hypothetical protein